ncbi:hypothetical protein EYV94_10370 [Puteibacter caeruleilacunae]|nr:hypothetical protein EYV94_10370 [Puteibacter caeruleilacunae]
MKVFGAILLICFSFSVFGTEQSSKTLIYQFDTIVILNNDTITIPEQDKVFAITVINDTLFAYQTFHPYEEETDFGETFVYVRNKALDICCKKELKEYAKVTFNSNYLIISDPESPYISLYDISTGKLKKKLKISVVVNDLNDFIASDHCLYISRQNEEGAVEEIFAVECGEQFDCNTIKLDDKGYYSLTKIDQDKVALIDAEGNIVRHLQ